MSSAQVEVRCAVGSRECIRPGRVIRFVVNGSRSPTTSTVNSHASTFSPQIEATEPESATPSTPRASVSIDRIESLAASDPTKALVDLEIANLFAHYIAVLAPWYDLNDPPRTFGTIVPETALRMPILFKAIIAFSACHRNRINGSATEVANVFHDAQLKFLIPDCKGAIWLATCLLRSYEIINGGTQIQSHLLGAYSYATSEAIDFSEPGMLQTGAWNYLREEITVGLIQRRGVRMGQIFDGHLQRGPHKIHPSDSITYLLAQIINFCFPDPSLQTSLQDRHTLWRSIHADFMAWKADLPSTFEPFSLAAKPGDPFPSLWMLRPWHVAEIMLALYDPCPTGGHLGPRSFRFAEEQALDICGLAWTNEDDSARVNAFGPLAFCGRYLSLQHHQKELEEYLLQSSRATGWPVNDIVKDLQVHWAAGY
ncbi:hypothetical protein EDD36DRAFT_415380 [Exophiala viscosa]|uniref:Transcription factor domain-containing protein n=1 Tax=Exophiala viscosa TaxID=2486360 RepID=A0AAN6E1H0_9EURO|nr:hypothetical protein EDD36DRAFT_415380 [Exophiala viscosa]